jgi:mRNA interferase MazF
VKPHRGDIWLVDFGEPVGHEQSGRRPALVVSANPLNLGPAGVLIVVPLTTTRRQLPSHVEIERGHGSGLRQASYAKGEDVRSVSEARLVRRMGAADPTVLLAVGRVLAFLLEL